MTPSSKASKPGPAGRPPGRPAPTQGERLWRSAFFGFSALMAAFAMVDFDAGRLAHGLGDTGVTCLLLSLMSQFPFVRAIVAAGGRDTPSGAREQLLREAEQMRREHPWTERLSQLGWMLLLASLLLRVTGVD